MVMVVIDEWSKLSKRTSITEIIKLDAMQSLTLARQAVPFAACVH